MRVHVEFDVDIQGNATESEVEEWLRYELHDNGSMRSSNPLIETEVEPVLWSFKWSRL